MLALRADASSRPKFEPGEEGANGIRLHVDRALSGRFEGGTDAPAAMLTVLPWSQ